MKGKKRAKSTDFPSKKRKLGKSKRPAENATRVSFKSKSIVVPSQLEQTQQPTGRRKLSLEALIRHLDHFKPSMRCDGLTGLRELFQDHPHLLIPNLAKLVDKVLCKIIDPDASVRHSLYTLLSDIFSVVSSDHVCAHFSSIVAHLSCGLTHISDKVQLDSLRMFGLLMAHYSMLLPAHAQQLLPLIVRLISRHKSASSSQKTSKTKTQASLAHDPRSKLSRFSSRIDVFNLLFHFLETVLKSVDPIKEMRKTDKTPATVDLQRQRVVIERDGEFKQVHCDLVDFSSVPHVMPLKREGLPYQLTVSPVASLPTEFNAVSTSVASTVSICPSSRSSLISPDSVFSDVAKFIEFSESLVSLLFECWVECSLVQKHVSKDCLVLMETVINLLCLVLKLAVHVNSSESDTRSAEHCSTLAPSPVINTLSEKYTAFYLKHFVTKFPLHCPSATSSHSVQYTRMNLVLCQITALLSKSGDPTYQSALDSVCTFYGTLEGVSDPTSDSSQTALECSRIISETLPELLDAVDRHRLAHSNLQCVLTGVEAFYSRCHTQSSAKRVLIHCFGNLLERHGTTSRVFESLLVPWLESLPHLLVDLGHANPSLSAFIIDSMTSAAVQACVPLKQLENHIASVLDGDSILSELPSATQRKFVELLWLVPTLSPELLSLIRAWVHCGGCGNSAVATYLVEIVHHRFWRKKPERESMVGRSSQYLTFMLELLLGGAKRTKKPPENHFQGGVCIALVDDYGDTEHWTKVVEVVCECLKSTHFSDQVLELVSPTLQATLDGVTSLRVDTALAILCLVHRLSPCGDILGTLAVSLTRLCLSVVVLTRQKSARCSEVVEACSVTTSRLMKVSRRLLVSVLELFGTNITKMSAASVEARRGLALGYLSLLDSTELNSALRECSTVVQSTASDITVALTDAEQDITVRIKLSVIKFPTRM